MPTKWLQERTNGSKNEHGIPPHRALCGSSQSGGLRDQLCTTYGPKVNCMRQGVWEWAVGWATPFLLLGFGRNDLVNNPIHLYLSIYIYMTEWGVGVRAGRGDALSADGLWAARSGAQLSHDKALFRAEGHSRAGAVLFYPERGFLAR